MQPAGNVLIFNVYFCIVMGGPGINPERKC